VAAITAKMMRIREMQSRKFDTFKRDWDACKRDLRHSLKQMSARALGEEKEQILPGAEEVTQWMENTLRELTYEKKPKQAASLREMRSKATAFLMAIDAAEQALENDADGPLTEKGAPIPNPAQMSTERAPKQSKPDTTQDEETPPPTPKTKPSGIPIDVPKEANGVSVPPSSIEKPPPSISRMEESVPTTEEKKSTQQSPTEPTEEPPAPEAAGTTSNFGADMNDQTIEEFKQWIKFKENMEKGMFEKKK
jgi:hypothetical protein